MAFLALEENKYELFLMYLKKAMKDDKKIVDRLELTTIARDNLNEILKEYRKKLKRAWKHSLKK